jgi:methylphosphotriester-DNA--protein-cysteine methyltransferase
MIHHIELGKDATTRSKQVGALIHAGRIQYGGNQKLKIYGLLSCASGKRMKPANRVFFENENEAIAAGYRPCGHCMREKYRAHQQAR